MVAGGVLSGAAPFGFLIGQLSNKLQIEVNALESKGAARLLAEPNLVTLSGETASFLAGGQFPIPEVGATGTPSFGFQPYGVGLSFTPTVLRNGVINLIVKPEVSEIDHANAVTVAGTTVPALTTRKASTTLELRDGQSFMLGGLLQSDGTNNINQLPWLGDMPVLGALFRSTDYQKNETDLVILVTPHIVRPLTPTDPVHTPLDSSLPPNDVDLFLMGDTEVSPELARLAFGALNRPYVGHILDLPRNGGVYVIGQGLSAPRACITRGFRRRRHSASGLPAAPTSTSIAATPSRSPAAMRSPAIRSARWSIRGRPIAATRTSP